jgi:hypothetical protein
VLNDHGASAKVHNVGRGPNGRSLAGRMHCIDGHEFFGMN